MSNATAGAGRPPVAERVAASLGKRYAAERRFRAYGVGAVAVGVLFLVFMFTSIVGTGWTAFRHAEVRLTVRFDPAALDPEGTGAADVLARADYEGLVKAALRDLFPEVRARRDKRDLHALISSGAAYVLRDMVAADPALIGTTRDVWVPAASDVDMVIKGHIRVDVPESARRVSDRQVARIEALKAQGRIESRFSTRFLTAGDSREPELAGIWGAVVGSFFSLAVCLALSFPLGVMTAVYLEEFAPRNRWTDLVEVNINNLAAVPSIVFGLLGLAMLLNILGLPRSSPLVGGMVLALMTLPTVIIAGRAALTAVPPSIREAALAVGASPMQAALHHVVPLAMPGMLTGTIIGMARALGETAPLLMIGMVAFIADVPRSILEPATALPVQIFLWADTPERGFVEKTSAAILVLLGFLVVMNLAAVVLRKKFERRW